MPLDPPKDQADTFSLSVLPPSALSHTVPKSKQPLVCAHVVACPCALVRILSVVSSGTTLKLFAGNVHLYFSFVLLVQLCNLAARSFSRLPVNLAEAQVPVTVPIPYSTHRFSENAHRFFFFHFLSPTQSVVSPYQLNFSKTV